MRVMALSTLLFRREKLIETTKNTYDSNKLSQKEKAKQQ